MTRVCVPDITARGRRQYNKKNATCAAYAAEFTINFYNQRVSCGLHTLETQDTQQWLVRTMLAAGNNGASMPPTQRYTTEGEYTTPHAQQNKEAHSNGRDGILPLLFVYTTEKRSTINIQHVMCHEAPTIHYKGTNLGLETYRRRVTAWEAFKRPPLKGNHPHPSAWGRLAATRHR